MPVNQKKRGRPNGSASRLNSEVILRAAKALMKTEEKIPSIRQLAANLNVDAMAIYYYFQNKNKLLEALTASLVNDVYEPVASDDWKSELYKLCTSYLTLHSNYPGLLEVMLGSNAYGPTEIFSKKFVQIIKPLKLDNAAAENAMNLLIDYLHGYALALNHNSNREALNISMLREPLTMYYKALENS